MRIAAAQALAGARGLAPDQQGELDRAVAELIASEMVSAERPEMHLNLATLYMRLGRVAESESELRTALRLDPRFVPALVNLADLLRALGRDADGERFLQEALGIEADSAEATHALGLLRVRQGRPAEAVAAETSGRRSDTPKRWPSSSRAMAPCRRSAASWPSLSRRILPGRSRRAERL